MAEYIQVVDLVNSMAKEALGETPLVEEDWSQINTVGSKIFSNSTPTHNVESATKILLDAIGREIFANDRPYTPDGPNIIVSNQEYGSATRKIRARYPEASENQARLLNDGQVYELDEYHAPDLTQNFWDQRVTFAIKKPSLPIVQYKDAFSSRGSYDAFMSMLRKLWVDTETYNTENLTKSIFKTRIAYNVAYTYATEDYTGVGGPLVVNTRALYNARFGTNLTMAQVWETPEFWRFHYYTVDRYARHMRRRNKLFNPEKEVNFTPPEYRRVVVLDDAVAAANYYLYNGLNQFNTDKMALPSYETITAWQGVGESVDPIDASTVNIRITMPDGTIRTIHIQGVLGVVYDRDAMMITPYELRGYTHFNEDGEFINPFYKREMGYINALDESAIVFTIS